MIPTVVELWTEPTRLGLGRVSVLDGRIKSSRDPLGGKSFIDDYIISPEPVVDFLTSIFGTSRWRSRSGVSHLIT